MAVCSSCGTPAGPGQRFCAACGGAVVSGPQPPPQPPPGPPYGGYGPGGYAQPGPPPGGYGQQSSGAPWLVIGLVGLLVAGLAGGGLWWWLGRTPTDLLATGEVFLEPAADPGDDAFTTSVATTTTPLSSLRPLPVTAPATTPTPPADADTAPTALVGYDATRPGLYGGTRDNASCDVEALIAFLQANPDKAAAFAQVQGLGTAQLPGYLRSLTPLLLRNDTRVINHGFRRGTATPFHAVLQAGTAVLVDAYGIPRVRCACGNPLLPPQPVRGTPTYTGPAWTGFSTTQVITIVNTTNVTVTEFVIIDATSGGYVTRAPGSSPGGPVDSVILVDELCDLYPEVCRDDPDATGVTATATGGREGEATLATGDVQITLRWNGTADLDLAVTSPLGDRVFYGAPATDSGGVLDVDANAACGDPVPAPVENIVWPDTAPAGTYVIEVHLFSLCDDAGPVAFDLSALIGGQPASLAAHGATAPLAQASTQPIALQLAQAAPGTVGPDQPLVYFTVDKQPGGGDFDQPEPTPEPTPEPAPEPGQAQPPEPGGDEPVCDCATQSCAPIPECAVGSPERTGVACTQHQGDTCRNQCCPQCSIYPCDCDNVDVADLLCAACCFDPTTG